jgi:hypothetical protein
MLELLKPQEPVMSDRSSVVGDLVRLQASCLPEPVLFYVIDRDDVALLRSAEGEWLRCLCALDWKAYRGIGAQYYQALWASNIKAARERAARDGLPSNPEGSEEAQQRLYQARPTGGNEGAPLLHEQPGRIEIDPRVAQPERLAPGIVPIRLGGPLPKCFFALFKSFIGVHLMGRGASAMEVRHHLLLSPTFVRACGFTIPDPEKGYRHTDVPALRKLEQFDQIMSDNGLWSQARIETIRKNLQDATIEIKGERLVHDTTHYLAYSAMDLHELPGEEAAAEDPIAEAAAAPQNSDASSGGQKKPVRRTKTSRRAEKRSRRQKSRETAREQWRSRRAKKRGPMKKKRGPVRTNRPALESPPSASGEGVKEKRPIRRSQSRTVKNCRCSDREGCPHPWVEADGGAGSVIKGTGAHKKKYWAHKAAVLSTTSGIPLDVRAATDAASHDGTLLKPHLEAFFSTYPEMIGAFDEVLADAAYDDARMKHDVEEEHQLKVRTSPNPRRIKTVEENLPKGMKSLSPAGTLTCRADREMEYRGARFESEQFHYWPPGSTKGTPACITCPLKAECCRRDADAGRHVSIPFTLLDHIDPSDPPMARRFKATMMKRPAVERAIKRIKLDFSDESLTRRGSAAFQAHLDRSLIAFHLMLRLE